MNAPEDVDLNKVWQEVAADVWASSPGRTETFVATILRSPALARALVTTPSLVVSWLLATAAVLGVGVLATASSGTNWVALLAPALAGVAIAYAYGPGIDPAFELSRTMPISDRMILLVRALAVFAVNAVLGLAASLVLAPMADLTVAWLVPMTAIIALALAIATATRSATVGAAGGMATWGICVLSAGLVTGDVQTAATSATLLPFYLIGAVAMFGATLLATRGARMERLEWR